MSAVDCFSVAYRREKYLSAPRGVLDAGLCAMFSAEIRVHFVKSLASVMEVHFNKEAFSQAGSKGHTHFFLLKKSYRNILLDSWVTLCPESGAMA